MNKQNISLKVARDLYYIQVVWTFVFLGVILIVNIVKTVYAFISDKQTEGFFNMSFVSSNLYMFIIGLIAISFLTYFVGLGVTRKDYFIGNMLASLGLALTLAIVTSIVFLLEKLVVAWIGLSYAVTTINEIELDGNILGDLIQMIVISPYVDPHTNLILATFIMAVNTFILYILGWMISATFYHFGVIHGLIAIIIAIIAKIFKDNLLRMTLDLPLVGWFDNLPYMPSVVASLIIFFLCVIILYAIHQMTKRVPVKM